MSYTIRYGSEPKAALEQNKKRNFHIMTYAAGVLLLITALALPGSREILRELLFPWMDEALTASFGRMLTGIGEGEPVAAAFMEFCREVINRAGIPV